MNATDHAAGLPALKKLGLVRNASTASGAHLLPPGGSTKSVTPKRFHLNRWYKEVLSTISALCASIIIFAILSQFNHRPRSDWRLKVSLNAVVSVFAVIIQACLLYPIEESLGQLKWMWYLKAHALTDMEHFDDASRGIRGSLRFLYHLEMRQFAAIGAVITLFAAGIDPFVQQTVQYYEQDHVDPNSTSSLPVSRNYVGFDLGNNAIMDVSLMGAAYDGILNTGDTNTKLTPFCPGRSCTFPHLYSSLGFCSACSNVSPWLQASFSNSTLTSPVHERDFTSLSLNVSLPTGLSMLQGSTVVSQSSSAVIRVAANVGSHKGPSDGTWLIPYQDLNITSWQLEETTSKDPQDGGPGMMVTADGQPLLSVWTMSETRDERCSFDWMTNSARHTDTDCLSPYLVKPSLGAWNPTVASLPDQSASLPQDVSDSPLGSWPNITATLCTLSLCNKIYSGSVNGGLLREEVVNRTSILQTVNQTSEQATKGDPGTIVNVPTACAVNGTLYDIDAFLNLPPGPPALPGNFSDVERLVTNSTIFDACTYSYSFLFNETIMYQLPQFFQGTGAFNNIQSNYTINVPSVRHLDPDYINQASLTSAKVDWGTSPQLAPLLGVGNVTVASTAALFNSLADAMTNHIRQNDADKSAVQGLTTTPETFIYIAYGWLVLPTVLVLASALFLGCTAHMVREKMNHDMVWRSSQTALLYHGLDNRDAHGRVVSHEEMKSAAATTYVRLGNEAAGWRLVPATAGEMQARQAIQSRVLRRRFWR